jgi:hypothetical protein
MGFHSSKNYVNGMTSKELGNALYHIARHTTVSKGYTQEFITNVLLRASEIVSLADSRPVHLVWEKYPEEVLRGLDEAIIHDWTPPTPVSSEEHVLRTSYEKFIDRQRKNVQKDPPYDKPLGIKVHTEEDMPEFTQHWARNKYRRPE